MGEKIDHEYTMEIVCPYCGYEFSDSWEHDLTLDRGWLECGECGKEFRAFKHIEVTYSTEKKEDQL